MSPRSRIAVSMMVLLALGSLAGPLGGQEASKHEENTRTLRNDRLEVKVDGQAGTLEVRDRSANYTWRQVRAGDKALPRLRELREVPGSPPGIAWLADFGWDKTVNKPYTLTVTVRLAASGADLWVEADMADRNTQIGNTPFLEPLVLDTAGGAIVISDYSNGHLYPVSLDPLPRRWFAVSRLDMPWIGVCDLEKGFGYTMIVETSDDAFIDLKRCKVGTQQCAAPQLGWMPSKKQFSHARRVLYHFASQGGYVALAKRYRAYAAERGLIVPFAEKLKKNPNIARLFGAPDVWGSPGLKFAKEAKAAGVDKMLIHGRTSPADLKTLNEMGYLTSEYDIYADILPLEAGKQIDAHHDRLPGAAVLQTNGERMKAWLTFDKKTQYLKRCPALYLRAAEIVVSKALAEHPFLGRFIDVATAEDLYECYDPDHPMTRAQKREYSVGLLSYVRSRGLVVGGEHGIWWAVPQLDYIEGMMSGGAYSWPAGHLKHPKTKDEEFPNPWGGKYGGWEGYARWGVGHAYRVPLWELVFHDCVVSTWYWGDASDWLLDAAPEVTPKKDAFNVLYGTVPLLWANREGSWQKDREVFLRTYRNTCKLHEAIAGAEMLSHEFLTPDRAVQRTRFANGTEVVVNFGEKPYRAELSGKQWELPENGFAVHGPKIEQSRARVGGRVVTTIRSGDYQFTDAK